MALRATLDFIKIEVAGGVATAAGVAAALIAANSPLAGAYGRHLSAPLTVQLGGFVETLSARDWIGHVLMAAVFFVLGLALKHEALRGELASPRKFALPVCAAAGGLVGAALAYLAIAVVAAPLKAWPIGAASDGGLVFAILAMKGPRLPEALRLFMLSLVIASGAGAVALIAVLYAGPIEPWAVVGAVLSLAALIGMSEWRQTPLLVRVAGFLTLGAFILKSGLDPSLAGFAAALTVPVGASRLPEEGMLARFIRAAHPYAAMGVLPLFAFAMMGLPLNRDLATAVASPLCLAICAALIVGKPLGVLIGAWAAVRLGLARRPIGVTWADLAAVALLSGAGFSFSLYIGVAALPGAPALSTAMRAGVLIGSLITAGLGWAALRLAARRPAPSLA